MYYLAEIFGISSQNHKGTETWTRFNCQSGQALQQVGYSVAGQGCGGQKHYVQSPGIGSSIQIHRTGLRAYLSVVISI